MTTAQPVHAHDCNSCAYLGTAIFYGDKTFDFWVCNGAAGPTLVCRWSSNGPDYFSCPVRVARHTMVNDSLYKYVLSLYDQWNAYRDEMGYRDIYW